MKTSIARHQRGAALLAMLLVLTLGGAWYLTSRLSAASANLTISKRTQSAAALAKAKQALIGYVAHQAAVSNEDNPGAFPCPETPSGLTSTTGFDGRTQTPNCTLPAVGRFPWRTIGSEKLVDASGEPLWYVVAAGWSKPSSTGNTIINSNCTSDATMPCNAGLLTVDGVKDTVALIIAPGPAFNVPAATGCTAWSQARPITANPPDLRNYLECDNATSPADASFVTTGPSASFNDQVVKITAAEVLPVIEAAIADRFQQEFGKGLRTAYSGGLWPASPVLPFAVPFANPTTNPANKLQGTSGTFQGLLPGNYAFAGGCACDAPNTTPCVCSVNSQGQRSLEPCTAGDPKCDSAFVVWRASSPCGAANCTTFTAIAGAMTVESISCTTAGTPTTLNCTINASTDLFNAAFGNTSVTFNLDAVASNVGMSLRQVTNPTASSRAPPITGIDSTYTAVAPPIISPFNYGITQATMNSDGSATVRIQAKFAAGSGGILVVLGSLTCSVFGIPLCYQYTMSVPVGIVADHPLVDPTSAYAWFYRNRWQEVSNYAVASGIAPSGARSCTTGGTCLTLAYDANNGKQRGLLMFAGQKLGTQTRPGATALPDLFEGNNVTSSFERRSSTLIPNQTFNDHFAVIDSN